MFKYAHGQKMDNFGLIYHWDPITLRPWISLIFMHATDIINEKGHYVHDCLRLARSLNYSYPDYDDDDSYHDSYHHNSHHHYLFLWGKPIICLKVKLFQ